MSDTQNNAIAEFAQKITGRICTPDSAGYGEETGVFNRAVTHHPAMVVGATSATDVKYAVRLARRAGLNVAVLNTGHGPSLPAGNDTLLVTTSRMTGITVDAGRRTARVQAGVLAGDLAAAAAEHRLAPLVGSSPGVGMVGFILGGGAGMTMGRRYGWAADHVDSIEVVTADGELREVSDASEPELFNALLGGKSNFGIVTSLSVSLFPVTRLYAGSIVFPGTEARAVLSAYRQLVATAPDELTSGVAIFHLPPLPDIPDFMQGMTVSVRISYLGDPEAGRELLAPLRACAPAVVDTVDQIDAKDFGTITNDPGEPAAAVEHFAMLREFGQDTADTLLDVVGHGSGTRINIVDIRHLGGAYGNPPPTRNAVGARDAAFAIFALTVVPPGRAVDDYADSGLHLLKRLAPWLSGNKHPSFLGPADARNGETGKAYDAATFRWLRQVKSTYDPENVFRVNHNIEPLVG